ncbi:MAG: hypothetical protein OXN86_08380 [Chloroflexota bacterium]|nr:hypothetical protein [Chloroflexota bacterium]
MKRIIAISIMTVLVAFVGAAERKHIDGYHELRSILAQDAISADGASRAIELVCDPDIDVLDMWDQMGANTLDSLKSKINEAGGMDGFVEAMRILSVYEEDGRRISYEDVFHATYDSDGFSAEEINRELSRSRYTASRIVNHEAEDGDSIERYILHIHDNYGHTRNRFVAFVCKCADDSIDDLDKWNWKKIIQGGANFLRALSRIDQIINDVEGLINLITSTDSARYAMAWIASPELEPR